MDKSSNKEEKDLFSDDRTRKTGEVTGVVVLTTCTRKQKVPASSKAASYVKKWSPSSDCSVCETSGSKREDLKR